MGDTALVHTTSPLPAHCIHQGNEPENATPVQNTGLQDQNLDRFDPTSHVPGASPQLNTIQKREIHVDQLREWRGVMERTLGQMDEKLSQGCYSMEGAPYVEDTIDTIAAAIEWLDRLINKTPEPDDPDLWWGNIDEKNNAIYLHKSHEIYLNEDLDTCKRGGRPKVPDEIIATSLVHEFKHSLDRDMRSEMHTGEHETRAYLNDSIFFANATPSLERIYNRLSEQNKKRFDVDQLLGTELDNTEYAIEIARSLEPRQRELTGILNYCFNTLWCTKLFRKIKS